MESANRRFMWHGMLLFLVGQITGFAEQRFANLRTGVAAHLEGVMNGTFLVALGANWAQVRLSPRVKLKDWLPDGIVIVATSVLVPWGLRAKALP